MSDLYIVLPPGPGIKEKSLVIVTLSNLLMELEHLSSVQSSQPVMPDL